MKSEGKSVLILYILEETTLVLDMHPVMKINPNVIYLPTLLAIKIVRTLQRYELMISVSPIFKLSFKYQFVVSEDITHILEIGID